MKIIIRIVFVVLLGVGLYKGYYMVQRELINIRLEAFMSTCNPVPREKTPEMIELKKKLCMLTEEENLQFRKAARASKTDKEFEAKAQELIAQWEQENKAHQLFEEYRARKQQRENN